MARLRDSFYVVLMHWVLVSAVVGLAPVRAQTDAGDFGIAEAADPQAYRASLTRIQEVADANSEVEVRKISDMKEMFGRLQQINAALSAVRQAITEIEGNISEPENASVNDLVQSYFSSIRNMSCSASNPSPFRARLPFVLNDLQGQITSSPDRCEALKRDAGNASPSNPIFPQLQQRAEAQLRESAQERSEYSKLKDIAIGHAAKLTAGKSVLVEKIDDGIRNINSVGTLPWIVGFICLFCLAILFLVKQFEGPVQIEWVSTGQATQFVTIILLLSIIAMLSINGRIGENTLGTLLGGVAGYVLAQGVGRSTARQAERELKSEQERRNQSAPV